MDMLNQLQQSKYLGYGVLDWHLQKNVIHTSSQFLRMLGLDETRPMTVLEEWQSSIHPEDREFVVAAVETYLAQQSPALQIKHRIRCHDGSYRILQATGEGSWAADGTPTRLILLYETIDSRKYYHPHVTEKQRLEILKTILNSLPDFLIRMAADGTYLDYLSGGEVEVYCAVGRFVGESIYDVLPPQLAQQRMEYARRALETGEMQTYDYRFPINSRVFYEEARIVKICEDEVLIIVRDITERKRAELQLKKSLEREQAVIRIVERMRCTLDIDQVFATTVRELHQLLQCDRTVIYRFNEDWSGQFVAESVGAQWAALLTMPQDDLHILNAAKSAGCTVQSMSPSMEPFVDTYLQKTGGGRYRQGTAYLQIDDIGQAQFDPCYQNLLAKMQAQAYIIAPIFQKDTLWGLLGIYQNSGPRSWEEGEARVVVQLGTQLAIAIQQAELFSQLQLQMQQQEKTLQELKQTQLQLTQAEKMASLGQLVAGVAHELNNPISFIIGNISPINDYVQQLLHLIELYRSEHQQPSSALKVAIEACELDFLVTDLPNALASIEVGAERILDTVTALKQFSRVDQMGMKPVDLHEGIESTLKILQNRLKFSSQQAAIHVDKQFGEIPLVNCYPAQINQVLMNLLTNAIDAIEERHGRLVEAAAVEPGHITLITSLGSGHVSIQVVDNGIGMSTELQQRIFDPFYTTKPVGKGTGLGLAISYQIVVENHGGQLFCASIPGQGTTITIEIPTTPRDSA